MMKPAVTASSNKRAVPDAKNHWNTNVQWLSDQ
jgi:hypothetical protein